MVERGGGGWLGVRDGLLDLRRVVRFSVGKVEESGVGGGFFPSF
jgi:hypothetical protein